MTTYAGLRTALADLGPPTADIRDRSHLDVAWMAFHAAQDLLRDLDAAQATIRALADLAESGWYVEQCHDGLIAHFAAIAAAREVS